MKVLVDGENFRHQVADVLLAKKLITEKNTFFIFNISGFFKDILDDEAVEIIYYTTKIKQPTFKVPQKLASLITKISKSNRKWVAQLTNQKIDVVKAGYLRVRESNYCIHCNKKDPRFAGKRG